MHVNEIIEVWKFVHFISPEMPAPHLPQKDIIATISQLKTDMENIKKRL